MSSTVSKQKMQKLMDEIEELKRTNRDHEDKIQHQNKKTRDLVTLNDILTYEKEKFQAEYQRLEQKNLELVSDKTNFTTEIEEYKEEIQKLKQENHELVSDKINLTTKIEKYEDEIQKLKQPLHTEFNNLTIYNRMTTSPVSRDKVQQCTEWWCPRHSNFDAFVKDFKPNNEIDKLKIQLGKARNAYWKKKNGENTCCKNDRTNKDRNDYCPPSNWPKAQNDPPNQCG